MRRILTTEIVDFAKEKIADFLKDLSLVELANIDIIQEYFSKIATMFSRAAFDVWAKALTEIGKEIAWICPQCGHKRKPKLRLQEPMKITVLGLELKIPKVYMECRYCDAPGIGITRVLTGLLSGATDIEVKLKAAYCGAKESYTLICGGE
mgnify:CR=1 FL=1